MSQSPLVEALKQAGVELVREDLKRRCAEIEEQPLGHLVKNALARSRAIEEQGRKVTTEDVKQFLDDAPAIIQYARRRLAEKQEGGG